MSFSNGHVVISNLYAHTSSAQPLLVVAGGANVSVVGAYLLDYTGAASAISVTSGCLRLNSVALGAIGSTAWANPLIFQSSPGVLQADNLDLRSTAPSGTAIQFNTDDAANVLGSVVLSSGWSNHFPFGNPSLGNYGAVLFAPLDKTSIQTGSNSFIRLTASAHNSTGFGSLALSGHQDSANQNTAFGAFAGYGVSTGSSNTFVGFGAGYAPTPGVTGTHNTAIGATAAYALTTASGNVIVGDNTAFAVTTGGYNTLIGQWADQGALTTGSSNIVLGSGLGMIAGATGSYTMNLGGIITTTGINTPSTSSTTIAGKLSVSGGLTGPEWVYSNPATTAAQLSLSNLSGTFAVESKLRFFGSFPSGDSNNYLAATLRGGFSSFAWGGSYLNVWITNAGNGAADDANMVRVAGFTPAGMSLPTLPGSTTYANDAAAAAGGVAVGQLYRNGSAVMVRVA
jgi:hypothetical protein